MSNSESQTLKNAVVCAVAVFLSSGMARVVDAGDSTSDWLQLEKYHWTLFAARLRSGIEATEFSPHSEEPLTLEFAGMSLSAQGCNTLSQQYSLENQRIVQDRSHLITRTLIGCSAKLLLRDDAVSDLLDDDPRYRFVNGENASSKPVLELESDSGLVVSFHGVPTARTRFGADGEVVYLDIAPRSVRCRLPSSPDRNCLQVRQLFEQIDGSYFEGSGWVDPANAGPWQLLYEGIERLSVDGSTGLYLPVKRYRRKAAAAGESAYVYLLLNQ